MKKRSTFSKAAAFLAAISTLTLLSFSGCSSGGAASSAAPASSAAESAAESSASSAVPTSSSAPQGTFKIALECAYAPYNWTQTDSSNGAVPIEGSNTYANGYDIQIAQKIANGIGAKLEVYKTEWTSIPTAILSGKVDAGICGMTVTPERKQSLLFSDSYYTSQYVVLVKKGGKFENAKSIADLKGAVCTSQQSTSWYTLLEQIPSGSVQPALADVPTMLVALNSGKCELLSCDKPTALAAVKAYSDLKMIEFEGDNGFKADADATHVCAALAKGNTDLAAKINKVLAGISEDDRTKLMNWSVDNQPST